MALIRAALGPPRAGKRVLACFGGFGGGICKEIVKIAQNRGKKCPPERLCSAGDVFERCAHIVRILPAYGVGHGDHGVSNPPGQGSIPRRRAIWMREWQFSARLGRETSRWCNSSHPDQFRSVAAWRGYFMRCALRCARSDRSTWHFIPWLGQKAGVARCHV